MKQNYRVISLLLVIAAITMALSSCRPVSDITFGGDVIRFGKDVETSYTTRTRGLLMNCFHQSAPYKLNHEKAGDPIRPGKWEMYKEIDEDLHGDPNNTSTYYAMELAARRIRYVRKKIFHNDPNTKYYIFLFTDGLENSSPEIAKRDGRTPFRLSTEKYQKRLHRKLKRAIGCKKNEFIVYPFVFPGQDLKETLDANPVEQSCILIRENLDSVRYHHTDYSKRPELLIGDGYSCYPTPKRYMDSNNFQTFVKMVESKREELDRTSYRFRVARGYANKKIKMYFFDSATHQEVNMTFLLKKKCGRYSATDINMGGAKGTLKYDREKSKSDDANVWFVIDDFRVEKSHNHYVAFHPTDVKQYYKSDKANVYQPNSEYSRTPQEYLNAYYIIVTDHSNSMRSEDADLDPERGGGIQDEKMAAHMIMMIMDGKDEKEIEEYKKRIEEEHKKSVASHAIKK